MLLLVALWSITHRYKGITGDAELYAMQALARIHPGLATDLYLQNVSQDRFTVFSPFYAQWIDWLGLPNAALVLTIVSIVWFLSAAWFLARALSNGTTAFLAVALLIITEGSYGGSGVFHYFEDWLTARSLGEALVVTALACHVNGLRRVGLLIAVGALFVHPLMALPGLLLLTCLWLPFRTSAIGACLGILTALGIACTALVKSKTAGFLTIIDGDWLEVVRERSQFLFLQLWTRGDWEVNARPFICLTLTAVAIADVRIRKLCMAAMLVGFTGLAVASIASLLGPVALLLQGQAWRWTWITSFASVLLIAPTVLTVWRDKRCGSICAVLLLIGWTFTIIDGLPFVALALAFWLLRERIDQRSARYVRWAAATLGLIAVSWAIATSWSSGSAPSAESGREVLAISRLRDVMGLGVPAVVVVGLLIQWIRTTRSLLVLTLLSMTFAVGAILVLPGSFRKIGKQGTNAEINEFSDWRKSIPPTDTVYVAPMHNSARFAWFTLERPSYLSIDQSAGVVFSRATALEIKRRSEVLLPIMDPDWKVFTKMHKIDNGKGGASAMGASRPFTRERLISVCKDPVLDFVVSKDFVGFDPLRHTQPGDWRDWNLYDCRHIRSLAPSP